MKIKFKIDLESEKEFINKTMLKMFASVINQDRNKTPEELAANSLKNKIKLWICEKYFCRGVLSES